MPAARAHLRPEAHERARDAARGRVHHARWLAAEHDGTLREVEAELGGRCCEELVLLLEEGVGKGAGVWRVRSVEP
jgi:hypothetical protein